MTEIKRKKLLVTLRHSPYSTSLSRAAVDLSLAMGAFEQDVDVLFLGDGLLQLLDNQHAETIGQKSLGKILSSLPLYDIDRVYVEAAAMSRYALTIEDLVLPVQALNIAEIRSKMYSADHILSC